MRFGRRPSQLPNDYSSDDNRDDSGPLNYVPYGPKMRTSCLVTAPAWSWQCGSLGGTRIGCDRVQRSHYVDEHLAVVERPPVSGRWITSTGKSTLVADRSRTGVVDLSHGQLVVGRSTLGVLGCI
jgi:hypothetical protein